MSGEQVQSFKVAATLAANRIVSAITGTANSVQLAPVASSLPLGVTLDTVLDTTSAIPVQVNGIAKVLFNGSVTSGNLVASDSSGRGVPHVDVTAASYVIGTLIGATVATTATVADVLIHVHQRSIP